jgi:hypothetical protein
VLDQLHRCGELNFDRAVIDSAHVRALKKGI